MATLYDGLTYLEVQQVYDLEYMLNQLLFDSVSNFRGKYTAQKLAAKLKQQIIGDGQKRTEFYFDKNELAMIKILNRKGVRYYRSPTRIREQARTDALKAGTQKVQIDLYRKLCWKGQRIAPSSNYLLISSGGLPTQLMVHALKCTRCKKHLLNEK